MLRSQRSRRHRRQQRPNLSNCPGPSQSAEESKPGDSDHETTSSSGGKLFFGEWTCIFKPTDQFPLFILAVQCCLEILFVSPAVKTRLMQCHHLVYASDWEEALFTLLPLPHHPFLEVTSAYLAEDESHSFMSGFSVSFSALPSQGK